MSQASDAEIPEGVEGQIYTPLGVVVVRGLTEDKRIRDASKYGVFCGYRCCKGRCRGCASEFVDGNCAQPWCTDDQKRNVRLAGALGYGKEGEEYAYP